MTDIPLLTNKIVSDVSIQKLPGIKNRNFIFWNAILGNT